jgi:hypothetical protein
MEKQANIVKIAFIRKVKGKGYCVFGHRKTKGGKRQNFGCYKNKAEAKKRLGQIYFFKGRGALDGMIGVADELDKKGMLHFADALMDCLEKIVAASLGEPVGDRPASITIGKVAALLERKGEIAIAEKLDAILPAVMDVECGAPDCPDCPDMAVSASLGRCHNVTQNVHADKLYAMAVHYQKLYREGDVDENSFEYRKFRELRYMLRTGFLFPPPDGQDIPKDATNWWDHFEKEAGK